MVRSIRGHAAQSEGVRNPVHPRVRGCHLDHGSVGRAARAQRRRRVGVADDLERGAHHCGLRGRDRVPARGVPRRRPPAHVDLPRMCVDLVGAGSAHLDGLRVLRRGGAVPLLRGRRLSGAASARCDRAPPDPERHPDPRRAHPDGDRRDDDRGSRVPLQLGRRSRRGLCSGRRRPLHDDDQPCLPARRRGADLDRHVRSPPRPRAPRSDHSRSG